MTFLFVFYSILETNFDSEFEVWQFILIHIVSYNKLSHTSIQYKIQLKFFLKFKVKIREYYENIQIILKYRL